MKTTLFNAADLFVRLAPLKKWLFAGFDQFADAIKTKEWVGHIATLIIGIIIGSQIF